MKRLVVILLCVLFIAGCSQVQMSAISTHGSTEVVEVVPTVATTASGVRPAARSSATIRARASVSIR